jgi:hypothetical protein
MLKKLRLHPSAYKPILARCFSGSALSCPLARKTVMKNVGTWYVFFVGQPGDKNLSNNFIKK